VSRMPPSSIAVVIMAITACRPSPVPRADSIAIGEALARTLRPASLTDSVFLTATTQSDFGVLGITFTARVQTAPITRFAGSRWCAPTIFVVSMDSVTIHGPDVARVVVGARWEDRRSGGGDVSITAYSLARLSARQWHVTRRDALLQGSAVVANRPKDCPK
jgi:hypothetical protein